MDTLEQNNQVAIIENSIEVFKTAPQILQASQIRKDKALAIGNKILAEIEEGGMTPELDERAQKFLANINKATTEMKDDRAPVTQIMDALKKMYTDIENEIDIKKAGTIPNKLQAERDKYVKKLAQEKADNDRRIALQAAKEKEAINIKSSMELNYVSQHNNYITERKKKMQDGFNAITLDNYDSMSAKLKDLTFSWQFKHEGPYASCKVEYHENSDLKQIADAVIIENSENLSNNFMAEMNLFKDDLVDKLPSKHTELKDEKRRADEAAAELEKQRIAKDKRDKEIALANEEEKKELEKKAELQRKADEKRNEELRIEKEKADKEKAEREEADRKRIEEENETKAKQAEQDIAIKQQGEETMAMFNAHAESAEFTDSPETKKSYNITVLHAAGYVQMFQYWFENEGKNLPLDKIGGTKLDQMKAYCEKRIQKDGTKIESKFLQYDETFKAVNRKVK